MKSIVYYFTDQSKLHRRYFVQCTGQNIITSHNVLDALIANVSVCNSICNLLNMIDDGNYKWMVQH